MNQQSPAVMFSLSKPQHEPLGQQDVAQNLFGGVVFAE
jgi:hypothetical protein